MEILRIEKINEIKEMAAAGYRFSVISEKTKIDVKTIRKYVNADDFSSEPPIRSVRHQNLIHTSQ